VIRAAELGHMRDLTDLTYETLFTDPHFGAVTGKRFRALASLEPKVVPAKGDGIDPVKANYYADVVRQQLAWIPNLPKKLVQLDWAHCHGRAALEVEWKENRGGRVQWRIDDLHWIHPRRLSFGPERELRVRDDLFMGYGFEARGLALRDFPFKFIPFLPQQFNDYPEREGFGPRGLYFAFFKRFDWRERMQLLEVFGKPWRMVEVMPDATVQVDLLDEAKEQVDGMGANSSVRLPKGVSVKTEQPQKGAGEIHKDIAAECDDQISKLVLGNTRTTDAKPDGLGGQQAVVMQDEQIMVVSADGWNVGGQMTEGVAAPIIEVNFGREELSHCPSIKLEFDRKQDPLERTQHCKEALSTGVPLKEEQVYEAIGYDKPEPGDRVVQQSQQSAPGPFGLPGTSGGGGVSISVMPEETGNDNDEQGGGAPIGDSAASPAQEGDATPVAVAAKVGDGAADDEPERILMPFGEYEDFDDCVRKQMAEGHDEESARRICGALQRDLESGNAEAAEGSDPLALRRRARRDRLSRQKKSAS
jgi:phage gp29-like protein